MIDYLNQEIELGNIVETKWKGYYQLKEHCHE